MTTPIEMSSESETHVRRFMKFLNTAWANDNVKGLGDMGDEAQQIELLTKYKEWLALGEPA